MAVELRGADLGRAHGDGAHRRTRAPGEAVRRATVPVEPDAAGGAVR